MCRSTFSTTTMASSTTMPIASTRPNSDSVLIENPTPSSTANVPMIETGTATSGMIDARQVCRNRMTTSTTSSDGFEQRVDHRLDRLAHEHRRVVDDVVVEALREVLLQLLHRLADVAGELQRVGAGRLEDRNRDGVLVVEQAAQIAYCLRAELDTRDVAQAHDLAVRARLDDDVAELLLVGQTALRIDRPAGTATVIASAARRSAPAATCTFCSRIASTTSPAVRLRAASFCGSSQTRME